MCIDALPVAKCRSKIQYPSTKIQLGDTKYVIQVFVQEMFEFWIHLLAHVDHSHWVEDAKDQEEDEGDAKKMFTLTAWLQVCR